MTFHQFQGNKKYEAAGYTIYIVKHRPGFTGQVQGMFPKTSFPDTLASNGLPFLASLVGHLKLGNWATKRQRERYMERSRLEDTKHSGKIILEIYKSMAKRFRDSGF